MSITQTNAHMYVVNTHLEVQCSARSKSVHKVDDQMGKKRMIYMGCLKMGYTPRKIAIGCRDNDQTNHWENGVHYFQTNPSITKRNKPLV